MWLPHTWHLCQVMEGQGLGEYLLLPRDIFVLLLKDLVSFLEKNQIPRPVILFMDGASPHISLAMAEYCKVQDIQPWLFKPNTKHITQPLDLTFMKSLKDVLKNKVTQW